MMNKWKISLTAIALYAIGCSPAQPVPNQSSNPKSHSTPVTAHDVSVKAKEALDVTGKFAAQSMEQFTVEAKRRLEEMDRKVNEWEGLSEPLTDEAKTKWNEQRELFAERRAKLQLELDKLKESSSDAWEKMKEGSHAAWNDLVDAFHKASEHFSKDQKPPKP